MLKHGKDKEPSTWVTGKTTAYIPLKPDSISHKGKKEEENGIFIRFEVSSETQLQKDPANFVFQRVKKELMVSCMHLEN